MEDGNVLKVRGLPWSATKEDILKFFQDCQILGGLAGIHMVTSQTGRPSGEAFVEMETPEDKAKGINKDKEHMGHRYIEVFEAHRSEMELTLRRSRDNELESQNSNCIKLRGLPFDCSKEEIVQFFAGLEIVPNGVTLTTNEGGKQTGDAYVEFKLSTSAELALQKHREKIGHRYIEVFRCTPDEVRHAQFPPYEMRPLRGPMRGPAPYDMAPRGPIGRGRGAFEPQGGGFPHHPNPYFRFPGPRGDGFNGNSNGMASPNRFCPPPPPPQPNYSPSGKTHTIHMRGLPFRANKTDIADFFKPLNLMDIRLIFDKTGKPSGEAEVLFYTHEDAVEGMKKDKEYMQTRYIELFLNSSVPSNSSSSSNYPGGYGSPQDGGMGQGWGGSGYRHGNQQQQQQGGWAMGGGGYHPDSMGRAYN